MADILSSRQESFMPGETAGIPVTWWPNIYDTSQPPTNAAIDIPGSKQGSDTVAPKMWDEMGPLEKMWVYGTRIIPGAIADTFGATTRPGSQTVIDGAGA